MMKPLPAQVHYTGTGGSFTAGVDRTRDIQAPIVRVDARRAEYVVQTPGWLARNPDHAGTTGGVVVPFEDVRNSA